MEYEREFDYIARGSIIRSRATWYEQSERNTKYFLNLENNNKKKSCISTIKKPDGTETTDANVILQEIYTFYSDLYNVKPDIQTDLSDCPFFTSPAAVPRLNEAMKEICEGQGIMTAIDFEKAFDSLSRYFLFKSLESFGFGVSFIKWIKTFYSNITSCVANNVFFFTPSFRIKRGVRQGDPLSPSLFIIVLELVAISIQSNIQSNMILLDVIKSFGRYSGLKMNQDKTEALLLGNYAPNNLSLGTIEIKKSIKILGVHFMYNSSFFYKLNFESTEKSLRNMLKG